MRYICVKQHDQADCGPACIATIAKMNGFSVNIAKLRKVAGTDKQGTNIYGMVKAAESLGFAVKAVKGDERIFNSEIPLPCIAHMKRNSGGYHYVVIHKISSKYITIADPGIGIKKMKISQFLGEENDENAMSWTGNMIFMVFKETEKCNVKQEPKSNIFTLLLQHKRLIFLVFAISICYTLASVAGSYFYKLLIDKIIPGSLEKVLIRISIAMILLGIFKNVMEFIRKHLCILISQKLDISIVFNFYKHVIRLPMDFFSMRETGEIISRSTDAVRIREALTSITMSAMIDVIMIIIGAIILNNESTKLFLISFVIIVAYLLTVWFFKNKYEEMNTKFMQNSAKLTSYCIEAIHGIETIKVNNAENEIEKTTEKKYFSLLKSLYRLECLTNIQTTLKGIIAMLGEILILWIGGREIIHGNMTLGQLITFNSLLVYFMDPIKNIVNIQPQLQSALVAAERINEILQLELERIQEVEEKKVSFDALDGNIEFKNVKFRYGTRRLIIDDVSFCIKKGQKVGFVGASGSGKTTLAKLLLHLYEVENGEILINGVNINEISLDTLRKRIAYISQDTFLFSGSIYENLTLGKSDITEDEVVQGTKLAQAADFIQKFNYGYDTKLSENGNNLSGGQRQRLAIARALIKEPDILILDEATSNLDAVTENILDATLEEYVSGITTIFIAHRLKTIRNCDVIFVLDDGKITEAGSHEDLIKLNGKYAELVNRQSI